MKNFAFFAFFVLTLFSASVCFATDMSLSLDMKAGTIALDTAKIRSEAVKSITAGGFRYYSKGNGNIRLLFRISIEQKGEEYVTSLSTMVFIFGGSKDIELYDLQFPEVLHTSTPAEAETMLIQLITGDITKAIADYKKNDYDEL